MKKPLLFLVLAVLLILVVFNASRRHQESNASIRLPESQLLERLEEGLPFTGTTSSKVHVTLDEPRLQSAEKSERVTVGLQVALRVPHQGKRLSLSGEAGVSAGVGLDLMGGVLHLDDPVIERLDMEGIPDGLTEPVNEALTEAVTAYFTARPLYTLTGKDLPRVSSSVHVKDVMMRSQELTMNIGD